MLWYNTLALSLAVTWKTLGPLRIVEKRYEHKWEKSCFQYPWGKGFLTVSWCYHQFELHVYLLNGMGVSHPAFPYSSNPAGNSIRGVLNALPQEQSIHPGMLALLLLVPCLHSFPAASEPPDPFKGNSAACSIFHWIELQIWRAAVGTSHPFQFCVPVVPPMGPEQILRKRICWLSPLMRLTSGFARSQLYGPSCVWASPSSVTRRNKISESLHTTHGQWLTLPAALERQTCKAASPIRKNEARAAANFGQLIYLPTHLSTEWQELFWQDHPSANSLSAEETWKMDEQWEEHHEVQRVLQGITVPWC